MLSSNLTYDGYDPNWIIGTHSDHVLTIPSRSPYVNQSQSQPGYSHRGFFDQYDPYRTVPASSSYGRHWPHGGAPQLQPAKPAIVVARNVAGVLPPVTGVLPPVTTILYPHGQGHTLGQGHGYKNIVVMLVPLCCEGCEEKWKDKLTDVRGFEGVNVDRRHPAKLKVTVFGHMDTQSVVDTIRSVQPRAQFWGH